MFNALQFCIDHNIPYKTTGKNTAPGWIQINCPMCRDTGFHGGFNINEGYYHCWKCRHSFLDKIISELLNISKHECKSIIKYYSEKTINEVRIIEKIKNEKLILPGKKLQDIHKKYLLERNFDPDYLEQIYDLKGTTHTGNYKFRIIAPIYLDKKIVSFQGRDVTGKSTLRYKACLKSKEVIHHKHILYGLDLINNNSGVIVEGLTDAWRLGPGALCTFGTSFTIMQLLLMTKRLDNIFILFDNEEAAQDLAQKLACNISILSNKHIEIITGIKKDPGDMSESDAKYLMKYFLKL